LFENPVFTVTSQTTQTMHSGLLKHSL
jgi:hypothetical protein